MKQADATDDRIYEDDPRRVPVFILSGSMLLSKFPVRRVVKVWHQVMRPE